jgi:extracellular solute-binding protein (family 5)
VHLAGCARTSPTTPVPDAADPCRLAPAAADPVDTFSIALADPVDLSHAPAPTNDSERLLFRQLFPTLIRVDCRGQVQPGLATRWERDSSGRSWTFVLPDTARYPDGTPLTASAVSASWLRRWSAVRHLGVDSVSVLDSQRLAATMASPSDSLPRVFADPRMAVLPAKLPMDSGRLIVSSRQNLPVMELEFIGTGDLRDALDGGADLVVSRDPAVIDYATGRAEFETFALPWDRTYVLLQRPGVEPIPAPLWSDSVRRSLAYGAVRADARAAERPFWWHSPCAIYTSMHVTLPSTPRVVYQRSDPVARQLAERIIALAGDSLQLRAVGLETEAFSAPGKLGSERGYVVAVPHRPLVPCAESASWTREGHLVPLIDTRPHAIVRRGSPQLTVDWDGTVRVLQP